MKEIPFTKGQVALVDDEDYERLSRFKWSASFHRKTGNYYALRVIRGHGCILMHREIAEAIKGEDVDHRDHNTLLNTRDNLRRCTRSQNNGNQNRRPFGSQRFKGVTFAQGKFRAQCMINRVNKYLGCFKTDVEAARAYDAAARQYFGEFARVNFPLENEVSCAI